MEDETKDIETVDETAAETVAETVAKPRRRRSVEEPVAEETVPETPAEPCQEQATLPAIDHERVPGGRFRFSTAIPGVDLLFAATTVYGPRCTGSASEAFSPRGFWPPDGSAAQVIGLAMSRKLG